MIEIAPIVDVDQRVAALKRAGAHPAITSLTQAEVAPDVERIVGQEPLYVPGPLQTEAYARTVMAQSGRPAEVVAELVGVRLGRGEALRARPLETFVGAAAVHGIGSLLGESEAIRAQFGRLVEEATVGRLRLVPEDAKPFEGAVLLGRADAPDAAFSESITAMNFTNESGEVGRVRAAMGDVRGVALSSDETVGLLHSMVERYDVAL